MSNGPDRQELSASDPRQTRPQGLGTLPHSNSGELARLRVAARCLAEILIRNVATHPPDADGTQPGSERPADSAPHAFS